ncbi:DUF3888 domain-containing protein [Paenibacillus wynnii]|uniref:Uncharacterized protein n=1 Tax=Paenibacillus wynnii TaxID=268407 RepID=A0A098M5Z8_9BACL|nr:DUF3888 domain-containing protein [Paenibacillus wynnii]KGE17446.1 hypothetical protein PWYN_22855 [Paenibacillus wynnii]
MGIIRKQLFLTLVLLIGGFQQPGYCSAVSTDKSDHKSSLFALLYPYVNAAITEYYGRPKQYMNEEITKVRHVGGNQTKYHYFVDVKLDTFEHAHNPPYGQDLLTFEVKLGKATLVAYDHKGDAWEEKIKIFKKTVLQDIEKTFALDFTHYRKYDYGLLFQEAQHNAEMKPLLDISDNIMNNSLRVKGAYVNVTAPWVFLRNNEGYIVYKKTDGMNVVIRVVKIAGVWSIMGEVSKQGVQMKPELLWYMQAL